MNERIKELADQARKYARDYVADCKHYGHYMEHNELDVRFEEKFAELIVRECMQVLDPGEHQLIARFQARKWLQEHFGVEE